MRNINGFDLFGDRNVRGRACANKEVWGELRSRCKRKHWNVLRKMFVYILAELPIYVM